MADRDNRAVPERSARRLSDDLGVIVWINGPFGVGKSTAATLLAEAWPEATVFDPEDLGFLLRRWHPPDAVVEDFQDLPTWRRLVRETAAGLLRDFGHPLIVPMTLLKAAYFDEIVGGLRREKVEVHHFCLVAGRDDVLRRTAKRGDPTEWAERKYEEYESVIPDKRFAEHLDAVALDAPALAATIAKALSLPSRA
jgi:hypothetical protein